jgi:hypothetical protein
MRKALWIILGGTGLLVGYSLIRRQMAHAADPGLNGLNLPAGYLSDTTPQTAQGNELLTMMDEGDMRALVRRGINPDDCRSIGRGQWQCEHFHSKGHLRFTPAKNRPIMQTRRKSWWLSWMSDYATARSRRDLCQFAEVVPNAGMQLECLKLQQGDIRLGVPMTEIVGFAAPEG